MKQLFLVTHNLKGGGCERVISILANYFVSEGVEVTILPEHRSECFYALDPRVFVLPLSEKTGMGARDIPAVYHRLRNLVKAKKPDLVLAMPEKVNVWTVLYCIGTKVPVVVSERNDPKRHPPSRIKRLLRRFVYPFSSGFIFQTEQQADYFSKRIRARGVVLDNPVNTAALPEPFSGEREKTVAAAGRLDKQKNFPLLVRAFHAFYQSHPDWRLTIYGEGSERAALEALVEELHLNGSVSLPGAVKNLPEQIASAGMFVLSSDFEGLPNALIEALCLGLPCIATDCPAGGPSALIQGGQNGLLVPAGEQSALALAMGRLADNPEFANTLGKNAVVLRERLDEGTVAEKWREYLDSIVEQHRK